MGFRLVLSTDKKTDKDLIGRNVVGDSYAMIKLTTYMSHTDAKDLLDKLKSKGYDAVDYVNKYEIEYRPFGFAIGLFEVTYKNITRRDIDYSDIYKYIICHRIGCSESGLNSIVKKMSYRTHISTENIYKHIMSKIEKNTFSVTMNSYNISFGSNVFGLRKINTEGLRNY